METINLVDKGCYGSSILNSDLVLSKKVLYAALGEPRARFYSLELRYTLTYNLVLTPAYSRAAEL